MLLGLLCGAARAAGADVNDGWIEVRSPHFVVFSNAGEKEARRIADQFEQIRALFHAAFGTLRVDPAQAVLILAAKNENTMKALLPEEWEVKGHIHHAGLYQQGEDKHYVLLRVDSEGANPFHTLYHEYTHALLHLNFAGLPLWLDEGLAEFYGNSLLGEKETRVGTIDQSHLYILNRQKLLPIEELMNVEHSSPHYNEANRASVFYAESWAMVHYLMLDAEAQRRQLMKNFLTAWDKNGNQIQAAQETFGDLKRFGQLLEGYARQAAFRVAVYKSGQQAADKTYSVRNLPPGEVLALRGDCAAHRNRLEQAQPLLEQAKQLEPNLAMVHEASGFYEYRKGNHEAADQELTKAMELGSTSFVAPYYRGMVLLQRGAAGPEGAQEAIKSLRQATQINPQFAPAFEGLAHALSRSLETRKEALDAGIRAVKLDPTQHAYAMNLVHLLLQNDQDQDARRLAQRLVDKASSPSEAQMARDLLDQVKQHEEWMAQRKAQTEAPTIVAEGGTVSEVTATPTSSASSSTPVRLKTPVIMAVDGLIGAIDCSRKPELTVTLDLGQGPMRFHAEDFGKLEMAAGHPELNSCEKWKGQRVKIWFRAMAGKEYIGEMTKLAFE